MQLSQKRPSDETLLGHHHQNRLYTMVYFKYREPILGSDNKTNLKCCHWHSILRHIDIEESPIDQQRKTIIGGISSYQTSQAISSCSDSLIEIRYCLKLDARFNNKNYCGDSGHAYMTSAQLVLIMSVTSQIITNTDDVTH